MLAEIEKKAKKAEEDKNGLFIYYLRVITFMGGYLLSVEIENNESFGIFNLEDFKLSPAHTDTNHPQGLFSSIDSLAESYHHIHHTHLSISLDYDGYSLHDPYHGSIDGKSAFFSKVESSNIAKFKEIFRI